MNGAFCRVFSRPIRFTSWFNRIYRSWRCRVANATWLNVGGRGRMKTKSPDDRVAIDSEARDWLTFESEMPLTIRDLGCAGFCQAMQ